VHVDDFKDLDVQHAGPLVDLTTDVPASQLERRFAEGLTDLAYLVDLAGRTSRGRLWDLVVDVEPASARAVAFAAAVLAAGQAPSAS
jgi:hypothetical protein